MNLQQSDVIGKRLKLCREASNETLEQIGELIGVHKSTILRWERGNTEKIAAPILKALANHFHVNESWLMGYGNDEISPENFSIAHSENMMDLYFNSIKSWSEDKAFTATESANIKDHFSDLLLRYKLAISAIANIKMNSIDLQDDLKLISKKETQTLMSDSKIREEYFKKYAEKELTDLKNWAGNLAWYVSKSKEYVQEDDKDE